MISRPCRSAALLGALSLGLTACVGSEQPLPIRAAITTPSAPAAFAGPVLNAQGTCTEAAPATAATIEPGIGECDLVRLKGKPPTDVLVGAGRSGREVQVLYSEPGAKELYFFVNNRLDRIVKS